MKYVSLIIVLTLSTFSYGQKVPHVSGEVDINMKMGLVTARITLSNLPELGTQYELLLNRGLNIKMIKDSAGKVLTFRGWYDGKMRGDALMYRLGIFNDTLPLLNKLYLNYTGAFPVYNDTLNSFDFKGMIAFNSKTARLTEQSKWYPVIYDSRAKKELHDVTYDLKVSCADCKSIFVNGDDPKETKSAYFTSRTPVPLLIFAGDYTFDKNSQINFINCALTQNEKKVFYSSIIEVQDFYQKKLGIRYTQKLSFVQHDAVKVMHPKAYWGFVTFPTFAIAGARFGTQVDTLKSSFSDTMTHKFYAHELGHFYFGTVLQPNASLKWFFLESTAEYLAIKATENKYGPLYRAAYMRTAKSDFKNSNIIPLNRIVDPEDVNGFYRYSYGPFLFLALEKLVGQEKMYTILQNVLKDENPTTDFNFFRQVALKSGVSATTWKTFEDEYISIEKCEELINKLAK